MSLTWNPGMETEMSRKVGGLNERKTACRQVQDGAVLNIKTQKQMQVSQGAVLTLLASASAACRNGLPRSLNECDTAISLQGVPHRRGRPTP